MLCWWRCWRHIFILLSMRSNVDAVLMTLLWLRYSNVYVGVLYRTTCMHCVYLPLVWRSYQPSFLLPSRPCLYIKIRCVYMLIYVSRCPVLYNISHVVFTTYIVCTSPWCGEILFPHACCRPDRVCIAIEWVSCLWLIYVLRRQTLGDEWVVFYVSHGAYDECFQQQVRSCVYSFSFHLGGQFLSLCWWRCRECYLRRT